MARCVRAVVFWTASGLAFAPLRASFRPRLAASVISPLRFANPSPPSGWVEDLHLLAVEHARHTTKSPLRGLRQRAGFPIKAFRLSSVLLRRHAHRAMMMVVTVVVR